MTEKLQQQTMEVSFLIRRMMLHPKSHKAIVTGRMDAGSASRHGLDAAFYQRLVVRTLAVHSTALHVCPCGVKMQPFI